MDCLFCKIVKGEITATIVYRDDLVLAFEDVSPKAPSHFLVIPQKHISTPNDLEPEDTQLIGHMVQTAKMLAKQYNLAEAGYRIVLNCNAGGGQSVFHLHIHLLGGRQMNWPPG